MARHYETECLEQIADLTTAPHVRQEIDRSFGLPSRLYGVTIGAYLAFLGIMAAGFQSRTMILPMVIFVAYIVMAFGLCAVWTRMKPDHGSVSMTWSGFASSGIDTGGGHISGKDAALQVVILPVLILFWGITVVAIAAFV